MNYLKFISSQERSSPLTPTVGQWTYSTLHSRYLLLINFYANSSCNNINKHFAVLIIITMYILSMYFHRKPGQWHSVCVFSVYSTFLLTRQTHSQSLIVPINYRIHVTRCKETGISNSTWSRFNHHYKFYILFFFLIFYLLIIS